MKKIIALTVFVTFLLLSVAGCTGGSGNAGKSTPGKTDTISWYYAGDKQPDLPVVMEAINKKLSAEGIQLNMLPIDKGAYQDKMNLMISAGEKFDICFTANWSNKFLPNVVKGAYLPLDDLINKQAPKLKQSLPDFIWTAAKVNNKIYAVPNYQILPTQFSLLMRTKFIDKYKIDFSGVKQLKDIEPILKTLKENEPETIPYQVPRPTTKTIVDLMYETIYPTEFVVIKKDSKDLKAQNMFETPEYKDTIKLMYDWYSKGYIRKDIAGINQDATDTLSLKYGMFWSTMKPGGDIENKTRYKEDMTDVPLCEPYIQSTACARTMSAISRTSQNPEKAIKLLEIINTDKELYNLLSFGVENVHYKKISDSTIEQTTGTKYNPNTSWMFGNQFNAFYLKGQAPDTWEKTKQLNEKSLRSPLWGFNFNPDPVKNEIAQVVSVKKQFEYIEFGIEEPTKAYGEMMAKMKTAGLDKIITEVQRQIDEWKNKK